MKKCPFCKEEVLEDAIKCKHCGSFIRGVESPVEGYAEPKLLPKNMINPNEKIHVEAKQDPNVVFAAPVVFILVSLLAPAALWISAPVLLITIASWRHQIFALTDKRAIHLKGILSKKMIECPLTKIQNIELHIKWGYGKTGSITFDTAGTTFKEMIWENVKNARTVYQRASQLIHK